RSASKEMTQYDQLVAFLRSCDLPSLLGSPAASGPLHLGLGSGHVYSTVRRSPEEIAEELLALVEFRALGLGTWLGTVEGEVITAAVEQVLPPPYRYDGELLVEGLKLAARLQEREGRRTAGLVALAVI